MHINPALQAWAAPLGEGHELQIAQVRIRRVPSGFELRHERDRNAAGESLREISLPEARAVAQSTAEGSFRPLKSAPNLVSGWRLRVSGLAELGAALDRFYPGAVADWHAARQPQPPVTHYREFMARQSGIYRIAAALDEAQAGEMARAFCHPRFCLKHRLWTTPGQAVEAQGEKSIIPCLEPCALLLELARQVAHRGQETAASPGLSVNAGSGDDGAAG